MLGLAALGTTHGAGAVETSVAIKQKVETLCQICHGIDGIATLPGAPNLAGQQKDYLLVQLRAYRDGSRHQPQMSVVAKMLSDDDIQGLAQWYSSIKVTVQTLQ